MPNRKTDYRPDLARLTETMRAQLGTRLQKDLQATTGLLAHQVSRVLNNTAKAPNFVETVRLGLALGLSPNQMVKLVPRIYQGFEDVLFREDETEYQPLSAEAREALALLRDERLSTAARAGLLDALRSTHHVFVTMSRPAPPIPPRSAPQPQTPEAVAGPDEPPRRRGAGRSEREAAGATTPAERGVLAATRG